MARPLIALLTDFGLRDHYVGTMKGVALGVCPDVMFVDISHDVPAHDVLAAALELEAAYKYFPTGTIFLVVVDPGVGSTRRGIAAEAGDYRFVAPDNGVLSIVFSHTKPKRVVELTDRRYARPTISRTFEGRDRFAPAAAWLAKGIDLSALGRAAAPLVPLAIPVARSTADGLEGEVLRVDRFGNLITNIDRAALDRLKPPVSIAIGDEHGIVVTTTYADVAAGAVCAVIGSSDQLEIAINGGSAAQKLGVGRGAPVRLRLTA